MSKYDVSKENKEIYVAEKRVDDNHIRYEFWQSENGWYLQCDHWYSGSPWPMHSEMWVPQEIIDRIITSDTAIKKLTKKAIIE
jgi:hypothetical protein